MTQPHRKAVITLYKNLLYLGREWPQGYDLFKKRLHKVFSKNSDETDPEKIKTMIKHGEFVVKEIEALYSLKKYRAMKRRMRGSPNSILQVIAEKYDSSLYKAFLRTLMG